MAEFKEIMKVYNRMCHSFDACNNCTLKQSIKREWDIKSCREFISKMPDTAEEIITKWSAEHSIVTNREKFKEVFGFECIGGSCLLIGCPEQDCDECKYKNFWDKEYKENRYEDYNI